MQQIEPLAVHPGEYAYGVNTHAGELKNVCFNADGYGDVAKLRVVVWDRHADGTEGWAIHEDVTLGGASHEAVIKFVNPGSTFGVNVRRDDAGSFPIGVKLV